MKKLFLSAFLFALAPGVVFAQPRNFSEVANIVVNFLSALLPVLVAIALLVFFWGLIKYIARADSSDAREEGKQIMGWGVVALFVMVSIWGLVAFMQVALFDRVLTPATGGEGGVEPGQQFYPGQGTVFPEIP